MLALVTKPKAMHQRTACILLETFCTNYILEHTQVCLQSGKERH